MLPIYIHHAQFHLGIVCFTFRQKVSLYINSREYYLHTFLRDFPYVVVFVHNGANIRFPLR